MTYKRAKMALLTGVSITILSGQAFAGNWDGFSFGIGGGYGIANNELGIAPKGLIDDAKLTIDGFGGKGGFFTFGAGYDRTIFNNLVIGAFVDYDVSDIDTTLSLSIPPLADANARADFNIENQLSIGGRLGYLVSPTTLFFTTFGYARVETSNIKASLGSDVGSISGTLASVGNFNGYFVGGGVETLISNGFSIKGEYRYTSLQTEGATVLPGTGISDFVGASLKPQIQTGRVSLNYRFGGKSEPADEPAPRAAGTWTGSYLGFGAGYGAATNDITLADRSPQPGSIFNVDIDGMGSQGGFISGTVGYDYQASPRIVVGAFADADFSNLHHNTSLGVSEDDATLGIGIKSRFQNIFMIGGRLGYLTTPDTLIFGSAGYANAGLDDTNLRAGIDFGGQNVLSEGTVLFDSKRFSGVFFGGGVETRLNEALSLKAEYRYLDLGSERMSLLPNDAPEINEFVSTKFDPVIQMGRLSINYRCGGRDEASVPLK